MSDFGLLEKITLVGAVFFFSFGVGLILDGNKLFQRQLEVSQRVDYKNTINPF